MNLVNNIPTEDLFALIGTLVTAVVLLTLFSWIGKEEYRNTTEGLQRKKDIALLNDQLSELYGICDTMTECSSSEISTIHTLKEAARHFIPHGKYGPVLYLECFYRYVCTMPQEELLDLIVTYTDADLCT